MPTNLVAIPPVARTVLYYVLALANAVLVPLTASGRVDPDLSLIVIGVSGVFGFTLAASNVSRPVAPTYVVGERGPELFTPTSKPFTE